MITAQLIGKLKDVLRAVRHTEISRSDLVTGCALGTVSAGLEGLGVSAFYPILVYFTDGIDGIRAPGTTLARLVEILDRFQIPVTFAVLLIAAFAPMILRQFVEYLRQINQSEIGAKALARVRLRMLDAIVRAEMSFHLKYHHADLSNTLWAETKRAAMLAPQLMTMITSAILVGAFSVVLIVFAPLLALFSLPMAFVLLAIHLLVGRRQATLGRELTIIQARSAIETNEILGAIRLIKLRRRESEAIAHLDGLLEGVSRNRVRSAAADSINTALAMPFGMAFAAFALYLGLDVFKLSLGAVAVFLIVIVRMIPQFSVFGQAFASLRNNVPGAMALEKMISDARLSPPMLSGTARITKIARGISFENVLFRYKSSKRAREAVGGITFEIPAGKMTALVGFSGAGKSTVVDLLSRIYDPTEGRVSVDGVDLRDINLDDWRANIAVVAQESFLFDGTVRTNLVYGLDPIPEDSLVWGTLEKARARAFIEALPQGLDTPVGQRGALLSGGQRQRLSLARALLICPQILILDEPTSALDGEAEAAIQRTLDELHGQVTVVVAAHRLTTIRGADQIVVLDDGKIVDIGTHQGLIRKSAVYRRLFEAQENGSHEAF